MFGSKIRALRRQKGMKVGELAEQIGVTSGYISQIERDLIEPSLAVLRKLADAMDVLMVSLFSDEFFSDVVVMKKENQKKVQFPESNAVYEFLTPSMINNKPLTKMEVMRSEIEGMRKDEEGFVAHTTDEFSFILSGHIEYHVEDSIYNLSKGDSIFVPGGTPHFLYNPSTTKAVIILAMAPGI